MNYDNIITYKRKKYGIIQVKYKGIIYPVLLDYLDYLFINKLKKDFKVDRSGNVYCMHTLNNIKKKIFIHHIIVARKCKDYFIKKQVSISHINGINLDNRFNNLTCNEIKKHKQRTININLDNNLIPLHVSYIKSDKTHSDRFRIKLNTFIWNCSSSKELSIYYKLEETKKFLRLLKKHKPLIFNKYFIEYTNNYINSINSYNIIIHKANYKNIKFNHKFINLLKEDKSKLTDNEKKLLNQFKVDINIFNKIF